MRYLQYISDEAGRYIKEVVTSPVIMYGLCKVYKDIDNSLTYTLAKFVVPETL